MMAMFPVFILGLVVGVLFAGAYFAHKKETPSEVQLKLQEAKIIALQADIQALEETNEELRSKLAIKRTRKKKVEETKQAQ